MNRREFMASVTAGGLSMALPAIPLPITEKKVPPPVVGWNATRPQVMGQARFEIPNGFTLRDVIWANHFDVRANHVLRFLSGSTTMDIICENEKSYNSFFVMPNDLISSTLLGEQPHFFHTPWRIPAGSVVRLWTSMEPPLIKVQFALCGDVFKHKRVWRHWFFSNLEPIE